MITAYYEYPTHAEIAGLYDTETDYLIALPQLEAQAARRGATLTETADRDQYEEQVYKALQQAQTLRAEAVHQDNTPEALKMHKLIRELKAVNVSRCKGVFNNVNA